MLLKEYISNFIKNFWWDTVFWIIWTPNVPLFDYLDKNLKVIQNTHENNCVYSAIWWYLYTWKIHFVVVTSWVWVTNLITALTDAYLTNIPVFIISTNSNTKYYWLWNHHDSSSINDWIDTVSLTKSCTCFSALWSHPNSISKMFLKAYNFALENKKPVHISISKNLFDEDIKFLNFPNYLSSSSSISYDFSLELINIFKKSKYPIIVTSNLVDNSIFSKFIDNSNIIFLNTLTNVSLNNKSEYFIWNYEYVKNDSYNKILDKLDLVVFLWNKLDKYFIDLDFNELSNKTILHISNNSLDRSFLFWNNYFFINTNVNSFISFLDNNLNKKYYNYDFILKYKSAISLSYDNDYKDNLFYNFLKYFNLFAPNDSSVFIDVGSVLNYCSLFLSPINKVYVNFSSSFFNMWNSYKSIWYSFYNKNNNFIFIWDWSFYMNLWEILTAIENNINLTFVILNNNWYSSPLYMKYWNDIWKDKFCRYSNWISLLEFSKSLNIKYFLLTDKSQLTNLILDWNLWVNIVEIKSDFNDRMPL